MDDPIRAQVLSQQDVLHDLYTVPAGRKAVVSTFIACNQNVPGAGDALMAIAVALGGGPDSTEQYIYRNLSLPGRNSFAATIGATLRAGDVVRVKSSVDAVAFNLFGVENNL